MFCQCRLAPLSLPLLLAASLPLPLLAAEQPAAHQAAAAIEPAYGVELEGFDYPYPVEQFNFTSQRQPLHMAYMDVAPKRPNGSTAVLLHGKNFCSATWRTTIAELTAAGYRVIAPDQIGFCKSSKPERGQAHPRRQAGGVRRSWTRATDSGSEGISPSTALMAGGKLGRAPQRKYSTRLPLTTETNP